VIGSLDEENLLRQKGKGNVERKINHDRRKNK
jgi:hypothetical protein